MEEQAQDVSESQVDQYFENQGEITDGLQQDGEQQEEQHEQRQEEEISQEQPQETEQQQKEKFVPYGAMHEERMKRKEIQSQLESTTQRLSQMEQGWTRLMERMQEQQQPKPPSFDEDPLESLRHDSEQIKQHLYQQQQAEQQRQQQYELEQRKQQFSNKYMDDANAYAQANPEFNEAVKFLAQARFDEYTASGLSRQEALQLLNDDEMAIASRAYQDGVNPAERIFKLAKIRGFQVKAQKQEAEQKLQTIQKGMQASKSLNGAGGKVSNEPTLESLATMTMEELDEFTAKHWDKLAKLAK